MPTNARILPTAKQDHVLEVTRVCQVPQNQRKRDVWLPECRLRDVELGAKSFLELGVGKPEFTIFPCAPLIGISV
jgi:hypothetical protein